MGSHTAFLSIVKVFSFSLLVSLGTFSSLLHASVNTSAAVANIPNVDLVGSARMKYLFLNIYDAALYAEEGQWSGQEPFVLSINYLRDLKGAAIAERSIDEIRQQGYSNEDNLQRWLLSLQTILPDVSKNTRINGVKTSDNATVFYKNDQYLGAIHDPLFTQVFFDIWLGEKTSQPKLRKDLLGENL